MTNELHDSTTSNSSIGEMLGEVLDNTVSFFYAKDKKDLPEMNDSQVIMLREIGDGWYLYKRRKPN